MILQVSKSTRKIIKHYENLRIGRKRIVTPYFMNLKKKRGELRVMAGKGSPEEIEHEVKVWAQIKGLNIAQAENFLIREFMIKIGIGIDCSGYIIHILNVELQSRGLKPVWHYLKYPNNSLTSKIRRLLRPVENTGANTLTSDVNCDKVTDLNDIRPTDLIRAKGKQKNAHHVAMVTKVEKKKNGIIKEFEYTHSHSLYEDENGVRVGKIYITDPKKELKNQKWEDHYKGKNYFLKNLLVDYEDNGIRRLKALEKMDNGK